MTIVLNLRKKYSAIHFFSSGEVILWDLSREDDLVLATSGIGDDAHREPVNKVHWIKDQSSKQTDYKVKVCVLC